MPSLQWSGLANGGRMANWDWVGPELPRRDLSVLRHILEQRAGDMPNREYVRFEDGRSWSYTQTWQHAKQAAAGLAGLGVGANDVVLALLPNGPDYLKTWFGTNFLGAALAAPNTALRGALLQHLITVSKARVAVVDAGLLDRLTHLEMGSIQTIVVSGSDNAVLPLGINFVDLTSCFEAADPANAPDQIIEPWQTQFILFTSGTTGPSKGAIVTYVQMYDMIMTSFGGRLSSDDNYLLNVPLFHVSGARSAMGMMMLGGRISLVSHFRTETFWDTVRKYRTTACVLLGGAATFLQNQPERDDDADNPMRLVAMVPVVKSPTAFRRRFGVDITTTYGMSELSIPIISPINPSKPESCGRLRPGYEARIVDAHDQEVPEGEVGELILRAERPWTISPGYFGMPEATAEAWRNGWFHTGDFFRRNAHGDYFFIDRKKDAIRRRGENISSYEVEAELLGHPLVNEAAVIGIPSPHGEDDIMAVIAIVSGACLEPMELLKYLRPRMAYFMLPRYVRLMETLPRTPSMRVRKDILRREGMTSDTWDREAAGVVITRDR
jgi:crotonobetaine/carnitine-CoA ligase